MVSKMDLKNKCNNEQDQPKENTNNITDRKLLYTTENIISNRNYDCPTTTHSFISEQSSMCVLMNVDRSNQPYKSSILNTKNRFTNCPLGSSTPISHLDFKKFFLKKNKIVKSDIGEHLSTPLCAIPLLKYKNEENDMNTFEVFTISDKAELTNGNVNTSEPVNKVINYNEIERKLEASNNSLYLSKKHHDTMQYNVINTIKPFRNDNLKHNNSISNSWNDVLPEKCNNKSTLPLKNSNLNGILAKSSNSISKNENVIKKRPDLLKAIEQTEIKHVTGKINPKPNYRILQSNDDQDVKPKISNKDKIIKKILKSVAYSSDEEDIVDKLTVKNKKSLQSLKGKDDKKICLKFDSNKELLKTRKLLLKLKSRELNLSSSDNETTTNSYKMKHLKKKRSVLKNICEETNKQNSFKIVYPIYTSSSDSDDYNLESNVPIFSKREQKNSAEALKKQKKVYSTTTDTEDIDTYIQKLLQEKNCSKTLSSNTNKIKMKQKFCQCEKLNHQTDQTPSNSDNIDLAIVKKNNKKKY